MLCSGGNDGKVLLQDWTRGLPDGSRYSSSVNRLTENISIPHGRKTNSVATLGNLDTILVADVTRTVAVYRLQ